MRWIDTHCHLDAPEFAGDVEAVRQRALEAGVQTLVLPAVRVADFSKVRTLAHQFGDGYALGIHPLFTAEAADGDLQRCQQALQLHRSDPRLLAVGEIGIDGFVPGLDMARQEHHYRAQLRMARDLQLPVILHVRKSADRLLKGLRDVGGPAHSWSGIAHAFNGSPQQAHAFLDLGFKLGFGGTITYERSLNLRRLAKALPLSALVLETDSPDIPPQWLYTSAALRAAGQEQGRNEPAQLPRIARVLAELRGMETEDLALALWSNACQALPRLSKVCGLAQAPIAEAG